ncbi:MAG: phenylalanine--tRNA ligase subunit beta [Magnetococcales bacterium]|nr:phenylalanine--tRNA ligase subunit beta [Magnetococcales bacterium]MBF0115726.1 phenylalanine--tRNA ligase subunit beta [Magnetococcales bacterium]
MKLTYRWLLEHLESSLTPQVIGERLTMAGLELEGLTDLRRGLERVQTGTLLVVAPHPNADRLTVCQVQVGAECLTIVCGATNHRQGDKVAVAREGAQLANGMTICISQVRGQRSEGMLCSRAELGLSGSSEGILILPPETADGLPLSTVIGRDDHLFELSLTPNRGDCLGVRGIARELGALTQTPLRPLAVQPPPVVNHPEQVRIEDAQGCPRYAGRIIRGVRIAPSPDWLRLRLEAVGLRSINNVVDVTNYILLDLNQPLHAFDLDKVQLPIVVRRAKAGECLRTLDGVERTLDGEMTVIADGQQALALAGIMGGEESGVTEATQDIFLEAAYFEPIRIARTGRKLAVQSDSRYRFERGIDPEGVLLALQRATEWIVQLAGGVAEAVTWVDAGTWSMPAPVSMRPQRINQLGGIALSPEAMSTMLGYLGCRLVDGPPHQLTFQPPSHRHDLRREEDLLEEVIRLYGYDRIQVSLPRLEVNAPERPAIERTLATVHHCLGGRGYLEVINYAFISAELQQQFNPTLRGTALLNPISAEQAVLRTCLVTGLVDNARRNVSRGNHTLRFYEVGGVFVPLSGSQLREAQRLALLLSGPLYGRNWHTPDREADFFDLKGDVTALLRSMGWDEVRFEAGGPSFLHPGRKAIILAGDLHLGWLGTLHPTVQAQRELSQSVQICELEEVALTHALHATVAPAAASRFPALERDFAFVVAQDLPSMALLEAIRTVDGSLIRSVDLFDLYTGSHLPADRKSLAVRVVLQADDRTLTDQEAQNISDRIVAQMAQQFAATLR